MITGVSIVGTIALIFYVFPLLGTVFVPMGVLYYLVSSYYRRTSIETKRLESISRSALYSSFSGAYSLFILLGYCSYTLQKL